MRKLALTFAISIFLLISVSGGSYRAASRPETQGLLAPTPAPVSAGASIAALGGLSEGPTGSVYALRGGGTTDFWRYNISQNEWTTLPDAPAPVGEGSAAVEVHSYIFCLPGRYYIAALRGGNTRDFWHFNLQTNTWCIGPDTPAPVGPGGAIARLQRIGRIYVLRGNGTTDFWSLGNNGWETLASTPGPVSAGGGLVGINYGTRSQKDVLYAVQGGGSTALWKYDVDSNSWTHQSDVPGPVGSGGAITSPNFGQEGTLNVLQGGGSTAIWSLDVATNIWRSLVNAPGAVTAGGATSNQSSGCDFAFVGGESNQFFSTGLRPCLTGAPDPGPAPDFSLSLDQPTITTGRGSKVRVTLNIVRTGNFTGQVQIFFPATLPQGIRLPEGLGTPAADSISIKLKVKAGAALGTHQLNFLGTDASGRVRQITLTLIVQ